MKIGVVYVGKDQVDPQVMFKNGKGSYSLKIVT